MSHIAIIPARQGSMGVPNKNMLPLWGKSLIAWAALTAQKSGLFSEIILSTDSPEYAAEGERYGCLVPYLRPAELSSSSAPIAKTLLELFTKVEGADRWEYITLLEPTCPLRTPDMVNECARLVLNNLEVNTALTLTEIPLHYHAYKQFSQQSDGVLEYTHPDGAGIRNRQELQPTYIRNGAAYTVRCDSFRQAGQIVHGTVQGFIVSEQLVNIDEPADIERLRVIEAQNGAPQWSE
jgi:CMP-N,N'-diacetyllegionaminic acid synthase